MLADLVRDHPEDEESRGVLGQSWIEGPRAPGSGGMTKPSPPFGRRGPLPGGLRAGSQDVGVRRGLSDALGQLSESHRALGRPEEAAAAARTAGRSGPGSPPRQTARPLGPPADLRAILLDLDFPPDPFR